MKNKEIFFLRSTSMGICLLSRQYGINVTTDAVEEKFKSQQIDSYSSLEKFFINSGIKINLVKSAKPVYFIH